MYSRKTIILIILAIIGFLVEWGLSGPLWVVGSFFDIITIAAIVSILSRWIRKDQISFFVLFRKNILFVAAILWAISGIFLTGVFAINSFPTALSEITVSDGKRSVIFVQMSHIGTERYYSEISRILWEQVRSGALIYIEWVRPGTRENQERFDRAIGFRMSSGTYDDIASFIGMKAQDSSLLDGISTGSLRSVDLSIDDIASLISEKAMTVSGEAPLDFSSYLEELQNMPKWPLFSEVFQAILNLSLRYNMASDGLLDILDPSLRSAILDKRNMHVIDTFLREKTEQVVILYGALHFEGMYALLKEENPDWKITSLRPLYPYKP